MILNDSKGIKQSAKQQLQVIQEILGSADHGVEEQFKSAVSLAPVLGPESDQNHLSLTLFDIDHRRHIGQALLPYQPAALQEIPFLVADNSLILLTSLA